MTVHAYTVLNRIGEYLVVAGVILFAAIDYPPAIVTIPTLTLDPSPTVVITITPLSILFIPGLSLMVLGALLSRYTARQLNIPHRFNRFRLLILLGVVLVSNIFYNWLFTHP